MSNTAVRIIPDVAMVFFPFGCINLELFEGEQLFSVDVNIIYRKQKVPCFIKKTEDGIYPRYHLDLPFPCGKRSPEALATYAVP